VVIPDLAPDLYDFKVVALSTAGTQSSDTVLSGVTILGLTALPSDPTGLTINASGTQALLTWNIATELDVTSGGTIQIRYHPNTGSGVTWETSQVIVAALQGLTTGKSVTLLIGTYMIKFIDSGGRESADPAVATNTFAPTGFNLITEVQEGPAFLGTKTNCAVNTAPSPDVLELSSGQTLMTYAFNNHIDLNSVKSAKITPIFQGEIFNNSDLFCNISNVCNETQICTPLENGSVKFLISTTQDDPTGTPTWTAYTTLIAGDYSARGVRFKVESEVANTSTTSNFSSLGITIDTTDKTETGTVTTSSSGDTTVTYSSGGFYTGIAGTTKPRIGVQIIGGSQGDEVLIGTSTATGFTISVFNGGSRVVRALDYQSIGQ
jgi:hypothetical protein